MRETGIKLKTYHTPLIQNVNDILLPPLHIKLGLAKKFIEVAVKKNAGLFNCLKTIFPKLSDHKIQTGIKHLFLITLFIFPI